ncbi:4-nitrophenylphosphatase-like isoform X2 [Photinus pyralis]|uniref:4-nitrophenylphosphatase-like isoform X2 n=1 Tax=Photinus pyralis TaxID=7054 RepID=UPI0012673330|nr:4-nitrophenylphosphatase-like isoform X2 [Photinus pyralis]
MPPKDVSTLSRAAIKLFLNSFDTVLCDCDGVVWNLLNPIVGVKETLQTLRECGKKVHFVTNNSALGTKGIHDSLLEYDRQLQPTDVITPAQTIIKYLKEFNFNKEIYILGTSSMKEDFQDAGFKLAKTKQQTADSMEVLQEFLVDDESVGAVVCDYDIHLSNLKMIRCAVFLRRPDVLFILGATDKKLFVGNKLALPGPHFYQAALAEVTGRTPMAFGKPSPNLHNYITRALNIKDPSRVLFVGDSIASDIRFGSACGFQTLLVFSGLAKLSDLKKIKNEQDTPNYYLDSFGDLCEIIKSRLEM